MRGSTNPVYHCAFGCLCLHSSRAICSRLPENFCTTTLVLRQLVPQTHWETQGANVTFKCGPGPAVGHSVPQEAAFASYPARASKAMKHASKALSICKLFGPNITDARNIQPLAQRTADSLS